MKSEKNEKTEVSEVEELFDISDLKDKKGTDTATFEGMKAYKGWNAGKAVSEKEYEKAISDFQNAAIDGR